MQLARFNAFSKKQVPEKVAHRAVFADQDLRASFDTLAEFGEPTPRFAHQAVCQADQAFDFDPASVSIVGSFQ